MAGVAAGTADQSPARDVGRAGGTLPFGAVMATGAVSQLSGLAGLPALQEPLLVLTIVIAVVVTGPGIARLVRGRRPRPTLVARFGLFTVPVGLAVIAVGLAARSGSGFAGRSGAAFVVGAIAGVTTVLLTAAVCVAIAKDRPALSAVNGVWFIAPAAFLADAVAAAALAARFGPRPEAWFVWIGLAAVTLGTAGYGALLAVCVARAWAHGLSGAPRAAWWIVVGCGGLAALALGRVAEAVEAIKSIAAAGISDVAEPGIPHLLDAASLTCGIVATIALVPVAVGSVRFLIRLRRRLVRLPRRLGRAPWPPAFSTGVYALGCAEVAATFRSSPVLVLARIAAVETLVVWVVIAGIHVLGWLRHARTVAV